MCKIKKEKIKSGIYQIKNLVDGKVYIGSSKNIQRRWNQHKRDLNKNRHHNSYLQNSWNKYREESFSFSVIEYVENEELLIDRERFHINQTLCSKREYGYNILVAANSRLGMKHSKKTKERLSAVNLGRKHTEETKEKIKNCGLINRASFALLDEIQAKEIKLFLKLTDLTLSEISELYHIKISTVENIKNGKTWKDILIAEEDRLDWQLYYIYQQISSQRMKNSITIEQYFSILDYIEKGYRDFEIKEMSKTSLNVKSINNIRNGKLSASLQRKIELHSLHLQNKIIEDTSIYEWEDERVKKYYGI